MKRFLTACILLLLLQLYVGKTFAYTLKEGMLYYKASDYNKAEKIFREILKESPDNFPAVYMLAITLAQKQQYKESAILYRVIINKSNNAKLSSLAQQGLNSLPSRYSASNSYSAQGNKAEPTKAVLNVNTMGSVIVVEDVLLNDNYKTKFIFDTGATLTTISSATAKRIGVSTKGASTVKIMTGSGYINAPVVNISKVEIGGMSAKNVSAVIMDLPAHSSGTSQGVAGLLGLSFIENFKVTVDRAGGQITLEKN